MDRQYYSHLGTRAVRGATLVGAAVAVAWVLSHARVTRIEQFCSNAVHWRVALAAVDHRALVRTNGVHEITSYRLSNAFGLLRKERDVMIVTNAPGR